MPPDGNDRQPGINDAALIGSWDLAGDGRDGSGGGHDAVVVGDVAFGPSSHRGSERVVARLAGEGGQFEVHGADVGGGDFSLTAWVNIPVATRTIVGDIAAMFDPRERRGFSLGLHHSSPCGNHGNDRNLFFGLDAGSDVRWTDHGRPSDSALMICALAVHDGDLYAATWEAGASNVGHVYRLTDDRWEDCGTPSDANAVTRLAAHDGRLYAGTTRLRGGGSGMPDSPNQAPGGRVLRYEGGTDWSDCGALDGADSIAALVPFGGDLHAIPMYSEGVFRLLETGGWTSCGTPGRRLLALGAHAGALYGAGNDHADVVSAIAQTAAGIVVPQRAPEGGGGVFRHDGGTTWTSLGLQPDTTQVYSIETYDGGLHVGTWPRGLVYRHRGDTEWDSCGHVGDETEVMNLVAYNGKLYAGTLPGAEVHRLDEDGWQIVGTLDRTPDVLYRRAASMVAFGGQLYCGTLPSGTVHSMEAGLVATHDRALPAGWHHIAAVRDGPAVALYVDGALVDRRTGDGELASADGATASTLVLGGGPRASLEGELATVRLFGRALAGDEVASAASRWP